MKKDLPELKMPLNFMGKIADVFINRYKVVMLLIISVFILGIATYFDLPKETVPDISLNYIYVQTAYNGASIDDIDTLLSDPLEKRLSAIKGVEQVTANISNNYTLIISEFKSDMDMDKAEQLVRNSVDSFTLPDGATDPIVGVFETGELPIFSAVMTGDYDLTYLKNYADQVRSNMNAVQGVKKVDISGGYDREIQVIVDNVKLREYGLTLSSLQSALQASNVNLPAGSIGIDHKNVNVRVDERYTNIDDIKNTVITTSPNRTIFLSDVAIVRDSHKKAESMSRLYMYNDDNQAENSTPVIYFNVYRDNGYDIVEPTTQLKKIIEQAPGDYIPSDVEIIVTADQSVDVMKDLSTVINNAIGGLISVVIVLYIFIGLNEALIVSSVIPLSLFISLLLMRVTGISFNTISLTGFIIALGLLVDNAIVVMENVDRLRDEGVDRVTAARAGLNQVAPSILAATLTTVGAFIPVALTKGLIGEFLGIMPTTVIFIIVASLVVSIVVTPTLCARFLTPVKRMRDKHSKKTKMQHLVSVVFIFLLSLLAFSNKWHVTPITVVIALFFALVYIFKSYSQEKQLETGSDGPVKKYGHFLFNLLESTGKKALILLIIVAALGASIATIPTGMLQLQLFPDDEPTSIEIGIEAPIGTLLADTSDIVTQIENQLYQYDGLESFTSSIGGDGSNEAKITAELLDKEDRDKSGKEIVEDFRNIVKEIPGAKFTVNPKSAMSQINSGKAISLGLKGEDYSELKEYASQYYDKLLSVDGVIEPSLSSEGGNLEMKIDLDTNRLSYYGLNAVSVAQTIRQYVSGVTVGTYLEDEKEYDISIYYDDQYIQSEKDFDKIYFTSARGALINFNEVAQIVYEQGAGSLKKEDGDKIIYVEADLEDGYSATQANSQFEEAVSSIQLPSNIVQTVGGQMADLNEQIGNMLFNFLVALLVVYILLVIQFNSLMQPAIILLSVPFAVIGVVFGLLITGNNLGFYAMFGIVALVGIAVNDAIVLMDYTNYLRAEGMALRQAVSEAVMTRFQPVFATSLTTIGGVLPLALFNDSFSQLGYALIFGLVASTVLTLLIIPMIYYSMEKIFENRRAKKEAKIDE